LKVAILLLLALGAAGPATAGAGWYLLTPPITEVHPPDAQGTRGFRSDATLPLARWNQKSAFDTAKECEAALAEERLKYPPRPSGTAGEMSMGAHAALSLCVATDDPRLGGGGR
jgi:hypothetical protein